MNDFTLNAAGEDSDQFMITASDLSLTPVLVPFLACGEKDQSVPEYGSKL